jgi:hypothetical protein
MPDVMLVRSMPVVMIAGLARRMLVAAAGAVHVGMLMIV